MKQYKKYFRIAVIIRGQKRIWDYVKHNHFFYHERIAEHVDYYFVTNYKIQIYDFASKIVRTNSK